MDAAWEEAQEPVRGAGAVVPAERGGLPRPLRAPRERERPRIRLARPERLLAVVVGSALLAQIGWSGLRLLEAQRQLATAQAMIAEQEAANRALDRQAAERQSLAYVERMARSEFGLARPGETVYRMTGRQGGGDVGASGAGGGPSLPGDASSLGSALGAVLAR
ncbi:MAG: septum formation initiator family protein [Firmicutes bacterium]|nr:septum formation initiator family protein [Bacillota bacterium]